MRIRLIIYNFLYCGKGILRDFIDWLYIFFRYYSFISKLLIIVFVQASVTVRESPQINV